ncbi:hypothetical protein M758_11G042400 [Ceratodon purpureus]|nr:hypothetical protein M758_11G042400 [Ceratodon purpureus]KAG0600544.1 hypothetical protein M758_11G042400 [Ceratodon purpureus]
MATRAVLPLVGCSSFARSQNVSNGVGQSNHSQWRQSTSGDNFRVRSFFKGEPISSGFLSSSLRPRGVNLLCGRTRQLLQAKAVLNSAELQTLKFPAFLPPDVELLREPVAREMAARIQHVPVQTSLTPEPIMTSCVIPKSTTSSAPVMLLHGFDSSLLEWRHSYPVLEEAGVETWAIDILGWGFSNAEGVKSYNVAAKREHLYEFWKAYVKRPMVLVGPSLGGAAAIDFAVAHPEAVVKVVLVDAQGYTEGVGEMATLPKLIAYTGVALLKSVPLRLYANTLIFTKATFDFLLDSMRVGRLHCLMPGWADATVSFMLSGGYNVTASIPQVQQETLVIWGERDTIVPKSFAERFLADLPKARLELIQDCGHIPHVEKPKQFSSILKEFYLEENRPEVQVTSQTAVQ